MLSLKYTSLDYILYCVSKKDPDIIDYNLCNDCQIINKLWIKLESNNSFTSHLNWIVFLHYLKKLDKWKRNEMQKNEV